MSEWKYGDAVDFLGLTPEDGEAIDLRIANERITELKAENAKLREAIGHHGGLKICDQCGVGDRKPCCPACPVLLQSQITVLEADNKRLREAHEQIIVDYNESRDWPSMAAAAMCDISLNALKKERE